MSRYRKVSVRIWCDAKFRELSQEARYLWLYLLTTPDTTSVPGLFRSGPAQIAEALDWTSERFAKRFRELERSGMAEADTSARVVWLPNAVRYDPPANPNVVKGWLSHLDEIPECDLKWRALQVLRTHIEGRGDKFLKPFAKRFPEPYRVSIGNRSGNQEQEQEQEQEEEYMSSATTDIDLVPSDANDLEESDSLTPQALADLWNAAAESRGLPRVTAMKGARLRTTKLAIAEEPSAEVWARAFDLVGSDPFLAGRNDRGAVYARFDYAISPSKRAKWLDEARDDAPRLEVRARRSGGQMIPEAKPLTTVTEMAEAAGLTLEQYLEAHPELASVGKAS